MSKNDKLSYADFQEGTRQVLEQSQREMEPYVVEVAGLSVVVYPGVFSPKYFHDTAFFANALPGTVRGKSVMEVGPGCGVTTARFAMLGASEVVAVDINEAAVRNTRENARRLGVAGLVEVRQGDLYDTLGPNERFDVIFWNTPFGCLDSRTQLTVLERAVFDPGYAATARFIEGAQDRLNASGQLLIGFSSTLGKQERLESLLSGAGFAWRTIAVKESTEVHQVRFELLEARQASSGEAEQ